MIFNFRVLGGKNNECWLAIFFTSLSHSLKHLIEKYGYMQLNDKFDIKFINTYIIYINYHKNYIFLILIDCNCK